MTWLVSEVSHDELPSELQRLNDEGYEVTHVFPRRRGTERFLTITASSQPDLPARQWQATNCEYDNLQGQLNQLESDGQTIFDVFAAREKTHTYACILSYHAGP